MSLNDFQKDVILAPYTTYKIGGKADYFFVAKTKGELTNAIVFARKNNLPYFVLGAGANVLIGDKGYRGLVIKNETKLIAVKDNLVTAESGAMVENLIEIAADNNLSGLEHFAGIPSTVGGAMWQNLHFLSPDRIRTIFIEEVVDSAELLDEESNTIQVGKEFFKFSYDYSILHDRKFIVTEVVFKLRPLSGEKIRSQISENLKWRNDKQPQLHEFPSCGSVFKKIEGIGAGRLIDQVGLKGLVVGGVKVSEKHANYLVNTGEATALNVITLISIIQDKVKSETGYFLEPEIHLIGDF